MKHQKNVRPFNLKTNRHSTWSSLYAPRHFPQELTHDSFQPHLWALQSKAMQISPVFIKSVCLLQCQRALLWLLLSRSNIRTEVLKYSASRLGKKIMVWDKRIRTLKVVFYSPIKCELGQCSRCSPWTEGRGCGEGKEAQQMDVSLVLTGWMFPTAVHLPQLRELSVNISSILY